MSKRPSCILDPGMCLTLRPMKYPDFYDKYRDSIKNTWTVEEVDFTTDIMDLRSVEEPIRHLIERLVAFFATGDSIVSNNLVLNLYKHINAPEARMFLSRQLFEEALHVQFYLTLLDTYIPDQNRRSEAFSAVENVPSVKKKAEFCFKWIDSVSSIDRLDTEEQKKAFLLNLICFASCIEGLFFFAAFAYVYFLRSRGILNGLAAGTNWVFRDESCVHPSTDVLTPRGWVPFPELTDEDEVAQWDPNTEVISFVKPYRVVRKHYSGKLHHLSNASVDQLVTDDHDIVWFDGPTFNKTKASSYDHEKGGIPFYSGSDVDGYVHCGTLNHEVSDYDGMVYCVTVPTGAFVTRRDGKVSITGNCHMNFAFSVIEVVRRENPELFDDDLNSRIVEMIQEAVDCELQFAVDTLGVEKSGRSEILGLSYQDMSDYLGYVADTRLKTLGIPPVYNTKNPFSFMNFQDVQELANFFERRVSAYQTGIEGEVDLNGDF